MTILAWLGEFFVPGGIGPVEFGPEREPEQPLHVVLVKFALAVGSIALADHFIFTYGVAPTSHHVRIAIGAHIVYCLVGYLVRPVPDESNMGLYVTALNDPLSVSDDFNRGLFLLQLALLPGRYLTGSLLYFLALPFQGKRCGDDHEQ